MAGQMHNGLAARDKGPPAPCPAWVRAMLPRRLPASRASQQRQSVSKTGSYPSARQASAAARHSSRTLPVIFVVTLGSVLGVSCRSRAAAAGESASRYFSAMAAACAQVELSRQAGAAGDHIERVAENVAEHHAVHRGGRTGQREPPALDGRQPLADRVDLNNIGTAGQKRLCDGLQLLAGTVVFQTARCRRRRAETARCRPPADR